MNTAVFRNMSYGVYIVGTMDGDRPTGCTANSIMQITSSPATIAASINHDNYTNGCIKKTGLFSFSILAENSRSDLIGTFGFQSGKDTDKFQDVDYEMAEGVPVVKDSCGYVVCRVIDTMETSTHTVFLGEVIAAETYPASAPEMTYSYYHKVIKGKSPKNAPTYLPEEPATPKEESEATGSRVQYVCQVCGYVYDGDPLPPDFVCPVCKQGPDKFKRVEV
ncbi:MAG TPA: flavin reductase [Candidatus Bariatricus faecipullorum]|mgnify:CR=1 FL=1|nr:flavin reductase [Candidatus Bariatricus faecipullorum]